MKPSKLLERKIVILGPVDGDATVRALSVEVRREFDALCDRVRDKANVVCDNESLLLVLFATYEMQQ